MTRKDYEAIAAALARTRPGIVQSGAPADFFPKGRLFAQWLVTRDALIGVLAADNPRFDRPRFIRATEA